MQENCVFQIFALVVALGRQDGSTQTVVDAVIFAQRILFFDEGRLEFGNAYEQEYVADVVCPKVEVVFADFQTLGFDVPVYGVDGSRFGEVCHNAFDKVAHYADV